MAEIELRYFSCVPGSAVPRWGSASFIGATRSGQGFVWNSDAVVAVPVADTARYRREYGRALRDGQLKERTREDFDKWQKTQAAQDKAAAKAAAPATAATEGGE